MADNERTALWTARVAQWRESGLSQRAFGLQQGYPQRQLNYWVRRLVAQFDTPALLPVAVTGAVNVAPALSLHSPSGWTVMLPPALPTSWVAELLRSLA